MDSPPAELVVEPPREIDMATGPLLAAMLMTAAALRPTRVVVDFTDVTFCDSTAVDVLVTASCQLRQHGCGLEIRNPPRLLVWMAATLGLSAVLHLDGVTPSSHGPPGAAVP